MWICVISVREKKWMNKSQYHINFIASNSHQSRTARLGGIANKIMKLKIWKFEDRNSLLFVIDCVFAKQFKQEFIGVFWMKNSIFSINNNNEFQIEITSFHSNPFCQPTKCSNLPEIIRQMEIVWSTQIRAKTCKQIRKNDDRTSERKTSINNCVFMSSPMNQHQHNDRTYF